MNKKALDTEKVLEKNFSKGFDNHFYETIKKTLTETPEKDIQESLDAIIDFKTISNQDFEILGMLSYLIGIDFCNQPYLAEKVTENVSKRFAEFNFGKTTFKKLFKALDVATFDMIQIPKESLKSQFTEPLELTQQGKQLIQTMKVDIKSVFRNAIIPVNVSKEIHEMLMKTIPSHHDIIKINSTINQQIKYVGWASQKSIIRLYNNEMFKAVLEDASAIYNNQKFVLIYFDAILSTKEALDKFQLDEKTFINITTGNLNKIDFVEIENLYKMEKISEIDKPVEEVLKSYESMPVAEQETVIKENPVKYINFLFNEMLKKTVENDAEILQAIKEIQDNEDYSQYIYQYLKMNNKNIGETITEEEKTRYDYQFLVNNLKFRLEEERLQYKNLVEFVCQPLQKNNVNRIKSLMLDCFKELILETDQQKQYIISQQIETTIETYNHLQQLITLVESCDIKGDGISAYYNLVEYISNDSVIKEIFEKSTKIQEMELSMNFKQIFVEWFEAIIKTISTKD